MKLMILLFTLLACPRAFCQDSTRTGDYLRAHLTLIDTLASCGAEEEQWLCKFRLVTNYGGQPYDYDIVYACVGSFALFRWNPETIINNTYWLILVKTARMYNGLPVYRHTGYF